MVRSLSWYGLIILVFDAMLFFGVLYLTLFFREPTDISLVTTDFKQHIPSFLVMFFVYELVQFIAGFLSKRIVPTAKRIFDRLVPAHIAAVVIMALIFYLWPIWGISPKTNLVLFALLLFIAIFIWRVLSLRMLSMNPTPTILIGNEQEMDEMLTTQPLWNINVVERLPKNSSYDTIYKALSDYNTESLLVTVDRYPRIDILYQLIFKNYTISDITALREEMLERVDLDMIDELWFIRNARNQQNRWQAVLKRLFDLVLSIPLSLAFLLVLPFVALAIKLEDGGPVFYQATRVGLGGREFKLFKFRSMSTKTGGQGKDNRGQVTKVGTFLRKTSIDEFPQALSIIRGEQSFVGPRPEIPKLVSKYAKTIPHYNMRHLVRPGLTGWAQIKQKTAPHHSVDTKLTTEKLSYDLYYIKHNSVFLYIKIILLTFGIILNRTNH